MLKKSLILLLAASFGLSSCESSDGGTARNGSTPGLSVNGKQKLTLNWFVNSTNDPRLPSGDQDFVKKTIDEKFNVDLKIDYMVMGTDYTNKLNLLISSGETPDMFIASGIDTAKYTSDKVLRPIEELVTPATMPNYFKYWITEIEFKRYQSMEVTVRAPIPFQKTPYISYYIRQDWLDKLGLQIPNSYDEMINVMKAFVEKDPDGNGKNDTYGMTGSGSGTTIDRSFPEFIKNGLIGGFMLEGDQLIDVGTDIRIGQALDDFKKASQMKLYDPNWFLNKANQRDEKITQGRVGIAYSGSPEAAFDNHQNSYQKKTRESTGIASVDWQPFHPWAETGVFTQELPGHAFVFGVRSSVDKVKRSIEILDWLASEEGYLLTHYGKEDVHYKKSGQSIQLVPDAFKRDVTDKGNFLGVYSFFAPYEPHVLGLVLVDPLETERDRAILKKIRGYKLVPSIGTNVGIKEGMDLANLRKMVSVLQSRIIFEEPDASNWPKYRQQLMNQYGAKQIFTYYAEQITKVHGKTYTFQAD
ncbi:MAG: transporter substrate-binding protein [Paenibacillus sp.]|nr:transporter substrate-binding protein [Paenibacillus sp.]